MPETGTARTAILGRLRAAVAPAAPDREEAIPDSLSKKWSSAERLLRLRRCMEAVKTEFLEAGTEDWPSTLGTFLTSQGVRRVAYGPATDAGRRLARAWSGGGPSLVPYDRPIEEWKKALFDDIDAGFTSTRCAIADTGSLVLWPSPDEPRLLSLVPPIHVALLEASQIRDTFRQVLRDEGWAGAMPANALLISGPSKTADIEQTLAYGVHGPKRLVVVLIS